MTDSALANLDKIEHIVVLMMENRSFDHLLGYLSLEGGRTDVDGLSGDLFNRSQNGTVHRIHHLNHTVFELDPCHAGSCVDEQISDNNGGFVLNFERICQPADPGAIMGYYNATDLPVYDHLAREFAICDRWFSSVPGQTWPNRLYAVTGGSDGSRENRRIPFYNRPSFIRHLDAQDVSWRWYCHDFATLRLVDGRYRLGNTDKFFSFAEHSIFETEDFLSHAAAGELAAVSWIDPNFADYGNFQYSNDDHAPADIRIGQTLINRLYQTLLKSSVWNKTLLVVVYDEHGGFYDHVPPPAAADDHPLLRRYGCRVPALIVSPWTRRGSVAHTVFDHTSIIKTVLLRFCRRPDGTIPDMGARVAAANHLGGLLVEPAPRPAPPQTDLLALSERVASQRAAASVAARASPATLDPNEFQRGLLACQRELLARQPYSSPPIESISVKSGQ